MDMDMDMDDNLLKHVYVSGWLKRGPSGIIGTNISDAKDTVASIVKDVHHMLSNQQQQQWQHDSDPHHNDNNNKKNHKKRGREELLHHLKNNQSCYVTWLEYEKIDTEETSLERRRSEIQPREKIVSVKEMLEVAKH